MILLFFFLVFSAGPGLPGVLLRGEGARQAAAEAAGTVRP